MDHLELYLEELPLDEAKIKAYQILTALKAKRSKIGNLLRDIEKAPTSREVQRIMWNTYLSGSGYGISTSAWQKLHNSV
jgi:hypothetical protein